jgi:microcystin-dependent protein
MAALQTVAFGAASDGSQGDSVRTGFTKANSNTAVLQAQAALVSNASTITTAQALTVAHVGKRVNINLATSGTINLPSAATCAADNVLLLRNVGTTVVTLAITAGSGDTVALSKLNPGESVSLDTDGIHAWSVLLRGRSNADNETVVGTLTAASISSPTVTAAAPPGMVAAFAMATPPAGWLKCNGAAVSRTAYPDLFAAVSTVYGTGDGSTTFNLPDMRGSFPRAWDDSKGVDAGRSIGSSQAANTPSHKHRLPYGHDAAYLYEWNDANGQPAFGSEVNTGAAYDRITHAAVGQGGNVRTAYTDIPMSVTGENRPVNVALAYCIKT